jgi:hypothetical protein
MKTSKLTMNKNTDRKADKIREYCKSFLKDKNNCIHGLYIINAGEVHSALKMRNSYPAVCGALGSNEFQKLCNVTRVAIVGPVNGASTTFVFQNLKKSGKE